MITPGPDGEKYGIYSGDAFALSQMIDDNSVDLIMCDPVYWIMPQYKWLAETAARVLKDGGSVLAQTGYQYRYLAEHTMIEAGTPMGLFPRPMLIEVHTGGFRQDFSHRYLAGYHGWVWMTKGKEVTREKWVHGIVRGGGREKSMHEWGDSSIAVEMWLGQLTNENDIVLDPFTGSGTVPYAAKMLRRRWIAFEIDDARATAARERVKNAVAPMIIVEPTQLELSF